MPAVLALLRTSFSWAIRPWCHALALAVVCGCGNNPGGGILQSEIIPDECSASVSGKSAAADAILLEWDGGTTRIYPGEQFPGLDLDAFLVTDGDTLGNEAEDFKAAVRDEVSRILCDMPHEGVYITNTKGGLPRNPTTVFFSQIGSPLGGAQIGQGEYDPCNEAHDNHAIIFGDEILELGEARPFDEWVAVFANVTAHEIGHMLGYGHVPRVIWPASQRPAFVELMMATHTVDEMVQTQRLISDATNCPDDEGELATFRRDRITTMHCSHE